MNPPLPEPHCETPLKKEKKRKQLSTPTHIQTDVQLLHGLEALFHVLPDPLEQDGLTGFVWVFHRRHCCYLPLLIVVGRYGLVLSFDFEVRKFL